MKIDSGLYPLVQHDVCANPFLDEDTEAKIVARIQYALAEIDLAFTFVEHGESHWDIGRCILDNECEIAFNLKKLKELA